MSEPPSRPVARRRAAAPPAAIPVQRGFAMTWDQIEAAKWIAAASMLVDHVGAILLDRTLPALSELGRLAMPLFALLLGISIAKARPDAAGYRRLLRRLLVTALLASPAFTAWHLAAEPGRLPPLDIVFGLALGAFCLRLLTLPTHRGLHAGLALLAWLPGAAFIEFVWLAPALVVAGHAWARHGTRRALPGVLLLLVALCVLNGAGLQADSITALLAAPLLLALAHLNLCVPRLRHAFHGFYPLHLTVLVLLGRG